MRSLTRILQNRFIPTLLTAAGVTLLAAGLLQYGGPVDASPTGSDSAGAGVSPGPSGIDREPTPGFLVPTLPPVDGSLPPPSPSPTLDPNRVATRVVIDQLGIDLPVIPQPNPSYPSCNVAMYFQSPGLGQPGGNQSTYLYAHARIGMFYPLYERATLGRHGGASSLKGMLVLVYTSDNVVHGYSITRILPHVKADTHFLDGALAVTSDTLWLQTSTGPNGTYPKLQVVALPLFSQAVPYADAHPRAHPINCA